MFGPLGLSFAPYVRSSRTLSKWLTPFAKWYVNASGWRKYGFKYDDLCMCLCFPFPCVYWRSSQVLEESPTVQRVHLPKPTLFISHLFRFVFQALTRMTPREYYDRSFRLKRASQASVLHAPLPKEQWTKSEDVSFDSTVKFESQIFAPDRMSGTLYLMLRKFWRRKPRESTGTQL